ncbi:hypothetical protein KAT60_01520 [Candidatus Woesebacteria bacterium]|nr:hypothetical protein [Candidatus Woesebacteria bacterium]
MIRKNLLTHIFAKFILVSAFVTIAFFFQASVSPIHAVECSHPISGNYVYNGDCTFRTGVDGVDTGTGSTNTATLTAQSGILIVYSGDTLTFGSMILTGGSVTVQGTLKPGTPLWIVDADADGYPATTTQYAQTSAPTNGRRRNLMTSLTIDCDDSIYSATNECCNMITWYQDSDGDTYGNPSVSTEACDDAPPGGYVSNNSDCYDSNANAKPGQTTCYTTNRGDGSFDYNCDSTQSACNTCNTSSYTTPSLAWRQCSGGYCWTDPYDTYFTGYTCQGSTSTCGASGLSCTGSKASECVYSPCSLSNYYATGTTGCTVSCR